MPEPSAVVSGLLGLLKTLIGRESASAERRREHLAPTAEVLAELAVLVRPRILAYAGTNITLAADFRHLGTKLERLRFQTADNKLATLLAQIVSKANLIAERLEGEDHRLVFDDFDKLDPLLEQARAKVAKLSR